MHIAILSPPVWRTPPRKYGPWEQVASNTAEGLIELGIEVSLFATGDSITKGKLEYILEHPYGEDPGLDHKVWECLHISHLMEQADRFDIIHNHFDFLPLTYSRLVPTPMVTTIHGFTSNKILPVFKKYNSNTWYVSISNSDRSPNLDYTATVYNGIDPALFTLNEKPEDYLLFFGRIHPEKGTYEAIQIARACGRKLLIAGLIQDQQYFEEKIKPEIDGDQIIYTGNAGPEERDSLLGNAYALLHPISFEEPFGLSVAEAMLCGTPVIAFKRGSMPELIEDKKTGFLVGNIEEAVEAVNQVKTINRSHCRQWAENRFSRRKMAEGYVEVYKKILG